MNWVGSDNPQTKLRYILEKQGADLSQYSESTLDLVYYPTNKIRSTGQQEKCIGSGLVKEKDSALIVDYIDIDLPQSALPKNRILMLDIMANNDWKRPIYFSGGSFDKAEYIWMKDYLQLEGLAYKLVPIKTQNKSSYEMGRIDTDIMYDIVKGWEWGNTGSPDIYHDPQTRTQGLSFRSNLARLIEALISENKIDKAKEIIDLAMENLPVESYGFYTFVEPFVDSYYKVGETQKARDLFQKLKNIYQERLNYYAGTPLDEQYENIEKIIGDMEAYRRNIDILIGNNDREMAEKETLVFNEHIDQFSHFYKDDLLEEEPMQESPNEDRTDTAPVSDSGAVLDTTND